MNPREPVLGVCLAGPTAAGKSALAMAFAEQWPVEIISVDSALVYRGMDIGTAKPSAAEMAAVPHHLINILDPTESYSAAQFASDAARLAAEIRARGRLPLLVGGTMLYFKALREGLATMPAADAGVRAAIDAEARQRGWPALHADLARVDATTAARLAPADAQRIQRALEVFRLSGRPLSVWHQSGAVGAAAHSAEQWPLVSLEPSSRAWLHARIEARFDAMLAAGFIEEVQALHQRGDLHANLPAMRCVGYRQVWAAIDGGGCEDPPDSLKNSAIAATRQLAKRQLTWLRRVTNKTPIECDTAGAMQRAMAALHNAMSRVV